MVYKWYILVYTILYYHCWYYSYSYYNNICKMCSFKNILSYLEICVICKHRFNIAFERARATVFSRIFTNSMNIMAYACTNCIYIPYNINISNAGARSTKTTNSFLKFLCISICLGGAFFFFFAALRIQMAERKKNNEKNKSTVNKVTCRRWARSKKWQSRLVFSLSWCLICMHCTYYSHTHAHITQRRLGHIE